MKGEMMIPNLPTNIGDVSQITDIKGVKKTIKILDEIIIPAANFPEKVLCFQKVMFVEDNKIELRLAYYMVGVRGKTKGRWVWGQYATFILVEDMKRIIDKANEKGWFN
jgi:hypothetical protein